MKQILVTCPPMIGRISQYLDFSRELGLNLLVPDFIQTLPEPRLLSLIGQVDGWIIGDDNASRKILEIGTAGKLSAIVKWGIGIDSIDLSAISDLGIRFTNTPGVFGNEVADIAVHYLVGLARKTYLINDQVRQGNWIKPAGRSISECRVGVVGFGDIGTNVVRRLEVMGSKAFVIDPYAEEKPNSNLEYLNWNHDLSQLDYIVLTCSLNAGNRHMVDAAALARMKDGVGIINVSRGALIDELALVRALKSGKVGSCALDVFEGEPITKKSPLLNFPEIIVGSHNASNTIEAVDRVSLQALKAISDFLSHV